MSRGPPPKSMIKLYHLLRKVPFLPDEEIAEELGVKAETARVYRWRLRKKLVTGVTYFEYCPECFAKALVFDRETGEIVCSNCGYVVEEEYPEFKMSSSLPFGTEEKPNTFALESNIAYGKSLGFTMPKKHLYHILARVNEEHNSEAGLPVRQIQVITQTVDPPLVKSMLTYGSRLLKELGLDRDTDRNHIFADQYGRLLRKIAAYIMISKSSLQPHQAARAALYHLLSEVDREKAEEVKEKYPFNKKYLKLVITLHGI